VSVFIWLANWQQSKVGCTNQVNCYLGTTVSTEINRYIFQAELERVKVENTWREIMKEATR
jgi:hypothetical protein